MTRTLLLEEAAQARADARRTRSRSKAARRRARRQPKGWGLPSCRRASWCPTAGLPCWPFPTGTTRDGGMDDLPQVAQRAARHPLLLHHGAERLRRRHELQGRLRPDHRHARRPPRHRRTDASHPRGGGGGCELHRDAGILRRPRHARRQDFPVACARRSIRCCLRCRRWRGILRIWLLIGSIGVKAPDGRIFNRSFMLTPEAPSPRAMTRSISSTSTWARASVYRESATIAAGDQGRDRALR